ncbi:MAG: protein TolA [Burkholderiales bacterium PBB4]|nr:MAG: protein TolA [Burkholderiales bacterium PBB4]
MSARQSYLEFAPPPTPGIFRGVALALLAHGLLLAMLTLGVQWKREAPMVTAEAERWATVPQEAAPPSLPPEPAPEPEPTPAAKPPPAPAVEPPAPVQPDPSIAIERERARVLKQKQEADKLAAEKLAQEKAKAQKLKEAKDARDKLEADKKAADKKAADKLAAEKLAADKKKQANAKKVAELRAQNLKRMAGMAGTGSESSQGTAAQSSGPSVGYAGRISARIKPNITFTEILSDNPLAKVEVRTSPDGTIISRRIVQSSGVKAWDEAVLSAIDKTEVLPRDVDGRVPSILIIGFKPRD